MLPFLIATAFAGDSASPPPPRPPKVDFAALPAGATQRKVGVDGKPHPVEARLVLDRTAVEPGGKARIGLHLTQDEGWHTYWKSPGSIGQPTEITWTTPASIAIGPHEYPIPQRFEQNGEVSFGYDGQVLLISELEVPAGTPPGTYPIKAEASWLVCLSSCIPGSAEVEIPLTVGPGGAPSSFAPLFDHYAKQHPADPLEAKGLGWDFALDVAQVPADGKFRAVFLLSPADGAKLEPVPSGLWPTFTPITATDWSWGLVEDPKVRQLDDGRIVVVMDGEAYEPDPVPASSTIGGLVQVKTDLGWVRTEIGATLPMTAAGTTPTPTGSPLLELAAQAGERSPAPVAHPEPAPEMGLAAPIAAATPTGGSGGAVTLITNLLFAFLGGLILNVMPCVLPVLTLKLYGLVEQSDITPGEQKRAGLAYTGGILASFWALAAVVLAFQLLLGVQLDWGSQFQYPPYVAALATIVFVFGLSLFGVFEIPAIGVGAASEVSDREGLPGYFLTGVFATLLATPCSAPFLGTAVAYALSAPPPVLIAIFTMIAGGLAAPFLLIAFVPALYRFLPRPGEWMETFKQLLGFTLVATAVWLTGVLMAQIGPERTVGFLAFLMFAALGAWIFGRFGGVAATGQRQATAAGAGLLVATLAGVYFVDLDFAEASTCDDGSVAAELDYDHEIPWQPFTEDRVAALDGKPVFIDFTAEWCLTCKVNERTILETGQVRSAMDQHGVVPLKADWTRRDPVITEWLRRHNRAGVPMYLVLPSDRTRPAIVLPEVITPGMVVDALASAR